MNLMKFKTLLVLLWGWCGLAFAQDDPVIMTIGGEPVHRSEFEYSYNKNNTANVIDKKSVDEYVDLFVNYKLKVLAAKAAHLDTISSLRQEFLGYRNQQLLPSFLTDDDLEQEARKIYQETQARINGNGGLRKLSQIFIYLPQKSTKAQENAAKVRADSIYQALQQGTAFDVLARKCSDEKASAVKGGELPWIQKGQTLKEFEDVAFSLKEGEVSKPFLSPVGYHILLLKKKSNFFPYDSVRADILKFIDQRGLRESIIDGKVKAVAESKGISKDEVLNEKEKELEAQDSSLKYLIQEYRDGSLLYEISNRTVWEKAEKDEAGLQNYYSRNKKRYRWSQPRFKGIAYYTQKEEDLKTVQKTIKNVPFSQWTEVLNKHFGQGKEITIKAEKGIFKKGDNAVIDKEVFKALVSVPTVKGYPYFAVYGKRLKKGPQEMEDVRSQVVADYQEQLEREWVKSLRSQYPVQVNQDVLATVNKHH